MTAIKELPTFQVPLQKLNLLLPNACVAEIIPYEPLQRVQETPDWFLGLLGWRGISVPVISFEMLTEERASFSLISVASASLVVVRTVSGSEELPYFAIVAQALPRLMRLSADQLFETPESNEVTEPMKVRVGEAIASIPDIAYVEQALAGVTYRT